MQVSFNPIISNPRRNQPSHKAVIPKYVELAKKDIQKYGQMDGELLRKLLDSVMLFKKTSKQDAIDTLNEINKFAPNVRATIEHYLDVLNKY